MKKKDFTTTNSLKQHVKKANLKLSSQKWLQRQLNDPFVIKAKKQGYYARSAYKLIELNEKYKFLKPNIKVIDLGAAPGSWSQVVAEKIFTKNSANSMLISLDLLPIKEVPNAIIMQGDFTDLAVQNNILQALNGKANVIVSDMAPNTTGSKSVDHLRIIDLVEQAYFFSTENLEKNGVFIAKVFAGGTNNVLLAKIKQSFAKVSHFKPQSSRKDSNEVYVVAMGFKGVVSNSYV